MAESVAKHDTIFLSVRPSYIAVLESLVWVWLWNACAYARYVTIRMDAAFTLNCRPTVPVGCEEQVVDARYLSRITTGDVCWQSWTSL